MERQGARSRLLTAALVGPAALFFALLLVLPLVVVVVYSFGERAPAGGYTPGFTLANYQNLPARSGSVSVAAAPNSRLERSSAAG